MALSNWSAYNISALWSYARDGKRLSCLSQRNNTSIVGIVGASNLRINLGSDSSCWKRTTRFIRGSHASCYELTSIRSLQVSGRYGIHSLTEGMRYNVLIVVELLQTCITGPLTCTLIDSTGHRHDSKKYYCSQMVKNQIISLHVGQFCARKSLFGYGEINFSVVNTDKERKHGIVVIGALVVPVK
ncbi:uncharacterized protein LOC108198255 [Daucus carota subsp. sativus]|nr:PREDICTED: uncharacterized protein LOC108198255 [Daucus carota subsp. sativus]